MESCGPRICHLGCRVWEYGLTATQKSFSALTAGTWVSVPVKQELGGSSIGRCGTHKRTSSVRGLGLRAVLGLECRLSGLGFRVWGFGFPA